MTESAPAPVACNRPWVLRFAAWLCVFVVASYTLMRVPALITQRWLIVDPDGAVRSLQGLSPENGVELYALKFSHLECLRLDFALDLVAGRRVDSHTESEDIALLRHNLEPERTGLLTAELTQATERALERRDLAPASAALDGLSSLTGNDARQRTLHDWSDALRDDAQARSRLEKRCAEEPSACAALVHIAVSHEDGETIAHWLPAAAGSEPARSLTREIVRMSAEDAASRAKWDWADRLLRLGLRFFPDDELLVRLLQVDAARGSSALSAPELNRRLDDLRALSEAYGDRQPLRHAKAVVLTALARAERDELNIDRARASYKQASALFDATDKARIDRELKTLSEFAQPAVVDEVVFSRSVQSELSGGWSFIGRGNRFRLGDRVALSIELHGRAIVDRSVQLTVTLIDPFDRSETSPPRSFSVLKDLEPGVKRLVSLELRPPLPGKWSVEVSFGGAPTRRESFTVEERP